MLLALFPATAFAAGELSLGIDLKVENLDEDGYQFTPTETGLYTITISRVRTTSSGT